jgi:uncharacterized protein YycO
MWVSLEQLLVFLYEHAKHHKSFNIQPGMVQKALEEEASLVASAYQLCQHTNNTLCSSQP